MSKQIKLSILVPVYNHESFLRECLDGIMMQKTNFAFEAIVHDDVSTDGSAVIIREYAKKYPDIIKPIYEKENVYSQGKLDEVLVAASSGEYTAICEGDDYWTDSLKLQKQVDFLERHPEYGCCCHRFVEYYEDTKSLSKTDHWAGIIADDLEGLEVNKENYFKIGRLPQVLTMVYRTELLEKISKFRKIRQRSQYDQTMFYALVQEAPIWIMNEQMGVYRRHSGGVATSIKGSIEAQRKQYVTWKDTYEVYQTDETRMMYESYLKSYVYRYIKMAKPLDKKELAELVKECKDLYGGHLPIRLEMRMAKAYLLRVIKRN